MTTTTPWIFTTTAIGSSSEPILRGGSRLHAAVRATLAGRRIGILGWGPQARAQAVNLRETLCGAAPIRVGLRPDSPSRADARAHGFREQDGTLDDLPAVARTSDVLFVLISDAAQVALGPSLLAEVPIGATVGFSHGFLPAWLDLHGRGFRADLDVIGVFPKGMGDSVRQLYRMGAGDDGCGINASIAVHQDHSGTAEATASAWAVGIGAPTVFHTDMLMECRSDLLGERGILLGAVHGMVEALVTDLRLSGCSHREAMARSAGCICRHIGPTISRGGLLAVLDASPDRDALERACRAAYASARPVFTEMYDDIACGAELRSMVQAAGRQNDRIPVERSRTWCDGSQDVPAMADARTEGTYLGVLLAQVDELRSRGHAWSEIANESIIEAVDSLLPYMRARGIAAMIDGCSVNARIGARRWAPRFRSACDAALCASTKAGPGDVELRAHPIHAALAVCQELKPSVEIALETRR